MLKRPSSRLLVINSFKQILLFKFEHRNGPLAGNVFWATPGGAVDEGETFEDAARRELFEEVGISVRDPGPQVARRMANFTSPTGEMIEADERYFVIGAGNNAVSDENWTDLEREVMSAHRWWSQDELASATEQVWPETIAEMLIAHGAWGPTPQALA